MKLTPYYYTRSEAVLLIKVYRPLAPIDKLHELSCSTMAELLNKLLPNRMIEVKVISDSEYYAGLSEYEFGEVKC